MKNCSKIKQYIKIVLICFFLTSCSKENTNNQNITPPIKDALSINVQQLNFPSTNYVMVAAHRGGYLGTSFPENSLAAIQNSLNLGVDIIEIDIRITADNQLVVMHDKELDRTSNGSGLIKEHTLNEIKSLYLKNENGVLTDERVPTLEEVMVTVGNKALVFIDKSEYLIDYVVDVLAKTSSVSQSLFIDFINVDNANSRYGSLLKEAYFVPGIHNSNNNLDQYFFDYNKTLNQTLQLLPFGLKKKIQNRFH